MAEKQLSGASGDSTPDHATGSAEVTPSDPRLILEEKKLEIDAKMREAELNAKRWGWNSPAGLALITGVIGLSGTILSTGVKGCSDAQTRLATANLEQQKHAHEIRVSQKEFEYEQIKDAVSANDQDEAARRLYFLYDMGILDPDRKNAPMGERMTELGDFFAEDEDVSPIRAVPSGWTPPNASMPPVVPSRVVQPGSLVHTPAGYRHSVCCFLQSGTSLFLLTLHAGREDIPLDSPVADRNGRTVGRVKARVVPSGEGRNMFPPLLLAQTNLEFLGDNPLFPITGLADRDGLLDSKVSKLGGTTGVTHGRIVSVDIAPNVSGIEYEGMLLVESEDGRPFSSVGDAGAPVVKDGKLVGILFGGSGRTSIVCPIDRILEKFDAKVFVPGTLETFPEDEANQPTES